MASTYYISMLSKSLRNKREIITRKVSQMLYSKHVITFRDPISNTCVVAGDLLIASIVIHVANCSANLVPSNRMHGLRLFVRDRKTNSRV